MSMEAMMVGYRAVQNMNDAQAIINQKNVEIADLLSKIESWQNHSAGQEAQIKDLISQVEQLQLALAVKTAHAAGYRAYVKATKSQNPDISIFADSGQRYKDGSVKSNGALVYEAAFDAEARKLGLRNPAQYRAD